MAEQQGQNEPDLNQPPTEKILAMRKQNLSNNEIIQGLQNEGYNSDVILDAMNQADLKSRVEDNNATNESPQKISNPMQFQPPNTPQPNMGGQNQSAGGQGEEQPNQPPNAPQQDTGEQNSPPPLSQSYPQNTGEQNSPPPLSQSPPPLDDSGGEVFQGIDQVSIERIEEIAEAIIDEKWNEIVKSINKIIDWKERTESNINKLEQKFDDLRKEFDNLNKGVLGKIGEYDKSLGNLGVEIKAMERVFQKIIPTMTENVHALEKLTEKLSEEKK